MLAPIRGLLPILSLSGSDFISTSLSGDVPRLTVLSDVVGDRGLGGGEGEMRGSSIMASSDGGRLVNS